MTWRCDCGGTLGFTDVPLFDTKRTRGASSGIWTYRDALVDVSVQDVVTLGEGATPLIDAPATPGVKYKLEFLMPTGSFKDRGSSVLVSHLKHLQIPRVVTDSSGNAGASCAAYCSRAGIGCTVYVPAAASRIKVLQAEWYGAHVVTTDAPRDQVALDAQTAASEGAVYANHQWSPLFLLGISTIAYEMWEQVGRVPENIVVPVGTGSLLLGMYLGFETLLRRGVTDRLPRIFGVQAENCAPLYRAFQRGAKTPDEVVAGNDVLTLTKAEGIQVARPVRSRQILRAIRETNGSVIAVSEQDIDQSRRYLASQGLFVEPTSAVVAAALEELRGAAYISTGEVTVAILTGTGLKAVD